MVKAEESEELAPKVVVDTNVWLSALIADGTCRQVLRAWQENRFRLITSQELIQELRQVGERQKFRQYFDLENLDKLVYFITVKAEIVESAAVPFELASSDLLDDIFVACVLGGSASVLVTGNVKHFTKLGAKCQIMSPGDFISYLGNKH